MSRDDRTIELALKTDLVEPMFIFLNVCKELYRWNRCVVDFCGSS